MRLTINSFLNLRQCSGFSAVSVFTFESITKARTKELIYQQVICIYFYTDILIMNSDVICPHPLGRLSPTAAVLQFYRINNSSPPVYLLSWTLFLWTSVGNFFLFCDRMFICPCYLVQLIWVFFARFRVYVREVSAPNVFVFWTCWTLSIMSRSSIIKGVRKKNL